MNEVLVYVGIGIFLFLIYRFIKGMNYFKKSYRKELSDILTKDEFKVKGKYE